MAFAVAEEHFFLDRLQTLSQRNLEDDDHIDWDIERLNNHSLGSGEDRAENQGASTLNRPKASGRRISQDTIRVNPERECFHDHSPDSGRGSIERRDAQSLTRQQASGCRDVRDNTYIDLEGGYLDDLPQAPGQGIVENEEADEILSSEGPSEGLGPRIPCFPTELQERLSTLARRADVPDDILSSSASLIAPFHMSSSYIKISDEIARSTGTESLVPHVLGGVESAIMAIKNRTLSCWIAMEEHNGAVIALIIAVWLLVCYKAKTGFMANKLASSLCGTLMTSVSELLEIKAYCKQSSVVHWVRYWETRLYRNPAQWSNQDWPSREWLEGIPVDLDIRLPREMRLQALVYDNALKAGGIKGLADYIMACESPQPYNPLTRLCEISGMRDWLIKELIIMLAMMKEPLIKSLIHCSLGRDSHNSQYDAYRDLKLNKTFEDTPVIYINAICDHSGMPPTALQWKRACEAAYLYIDTGPESDELAESVDHLVSCHSWRRYQSRDGFRRYMDWRNIVNKNIRERCQKRRRIFRDFLNRLMERLADAEKAGLMFCPLADEIVEIGFTINPKKRLAEHECHRNSNYPMNLMQALLKHIYPETFKLCQHILYPCWRPAQCFLGEIVFTQLADGYTINGGGFSHYPAGRSNSEAYRAFSGQIWNELTTQVDKRWSILSRMDYWKEECPARCLKWEEQVGREEEEFKARIKEIEEQTATIEQVVVCLEAVGDFASTSATRLR